MSKLCHEDLWVPIADIINHSQREAKFPALYKTAEVIPIAKTNSPSTCKDHRPISLLWHVGKVAENFINRRIRTHILPKLQGNQFAYMPGVGCTDALVSVLDDVTKAMDNCYNIGAQMILYDFSKAFDLMNHTLLLQKLGQFELPNALVALVASYLENRKQQVVIHQHQVKSHTASSNIGVPQGTLCGPTLWLAFVDSLQFSTASTVKYADDTTNYLSLQKADLQIISNTYNAVKFEPPPVSQQLIDECTKWAHDNKMLLNATKTKTLNLSLKKQMIMSKTLTMNQSHNVDNVASTKLLGLTIDQHLRFNEHVANITKSANKRCHGLLVLKQSGVNQQSLVLMYKTQVVAAITHAAGAWYPYTTECLRNDIERCQRLAMRIIFSDLEHYDDRLAAANLLPLNDLLNDICHKYVHRILSDDNHPLHNRLLLNKTRLRRSTRNSEGTICMPKCRTEKRKCGIFANPEFYAV